MASEASPQPDPQRPAPDERLGRLERTFAFETGRIARNAVWGVVIGAVFTLLSIVVIKRQFANGTAQNSSGPNYFVGILGALALLLPLSLGRLVQCYLHRGERYLVYENGFVHHTRSRDETVYWGEVAEVRSSGEEKSSGWRHAVALDFHGRITCRDGRKFRLSTVIGDAESFIWSVKRSADESRQAGAAQ